MATKINKFTLLIGLAISSCLTNASAAVVPSRALIESTTLNKASLKSASSPMLIKSLDQQDSHVMAVSALKRKIELQKLEEEYKKNQSTTNINSYVGSSASKTPAATNIFQTVVSDVMINKASGKKFARLIFADGANIELEQGSNIDGYILTDINMSGVTLTKYNRYGGVLKKVHLARIYDVAATDKTKDQENSRKPIPTPILTENNFINLNLTNEPFGKQASESELKNSSALIIPQILPNKTY